MTVIGVAWTFPCSLSLSWESNLAPHVAHVYCFFPNSLMGFKEERGYLAISGESSVGSVPSQSQLHLVLYRETHGAHEDQAPAVIGQLF